MSKSIINDIDVSECPLFDKKTGCYHTFNGECVKDSCALYKWLLEHKRLQKENEELKKQLEFSRTHKTVLDAERIKYKKALEEIRKAIGEKYGLADIIKIRAILDEVLNDRD